MADPRVVHVEVNGQRYPIRSALDPSYVQELAIYVDRKMRVAFDSAPSTDALGLAILAALNIADEYFRARDSLLQSRRQPGGARRRTGAHRRSGPGNSSRRRPDA